ncbi:MAG TPA: YceI family protein [Bacteroidales bacterium]|nr:YceI family protein [Bacteroidales bacterium]
MKISTLPFLLIILAAPVNAQRYMTKTGHISIYSHTPIEDIKADNNQAASVMDLSTGEIVFQVLIKSFKFEKALMEEHFNENYMESDKYPKSTFRGNITDPSPSTLSKEGKYDVTIEGDLNIHNVTKKITAKGTMEVGNGTLTAFSKFDIIPADYNIQIPAVVRDNIAKVIEVTVDIRYSPAENK